MLRDGAGAHVVQWSVGDGTPQTRKARSPEPAHLSPQAPTWKTGAGFRVQVGG